MMKKCIVLLFTVLFLSMGQTCLANGVAEGIHVGNAGSFTGDAAAPCMEIYNSSQLAVDEWNARGGIQGVQIEHIMGDDALDPAQGIHVARKFTSDPLMYGVVGPPVSHIAQASLKIYGQNDLACITTAASKPELTESGYKHFFRVNARNDAHGLNCALFIKRNLKARKIAILNEKVAYCENLAKQTIKSLNGLGITEIMNDTIVAGAKDYSAVLTKVKAYKPDVLFFIATAAPDQAIGVRQAKELGIDAIFFGTEGARDKKDFIEASEGAAQGAYVYHFSPDIYSIDEAGEYVKKYEAKYGKLSGFGPPAYEAMNILLTAIDLAAKDGKIDREEVIFQLAAIKAYKGILGFPISFDEKGDLLGSATYFFKVNGADFEQVAVLTGK
ncbi:ABC-typ branched-chain amino acid transport system, periplasmic substrate binding component [Desulforapulum autotrophicum HRM2]|uniref:ABC-typ branched-chain amino acid transport system, periplasmic substrate binding component n=1 Tax=Desulforapulum autotrophicum (strain ATCC 43914 / DSM 3382 / VKM B-1955 / HRM2) TaxID=177437 RepID=C0QMD9_DESAH|nr:branched-chain amino acid ABC transporter substrate-binding protein [Desulforapulum autotrophicum]ACN16456.1 ABC-typ branched-chain amino acid transport system, periplasmic substrate binding component [Desulforapulum autotrophicum HRM2]